MIIEKSSDLIYELKGENKQEQLDFLESNLPSFFENYQVIADHIPFVKVELSNKVYFYPRCKNGFIKVNRLSPSWTRYEETDFAGKINSVTIKGIEFKINYSCRPEGLLIEN